MLFSDAEIAELDRVEGLMAYLKNPTVRPSLPSLEEYSRMPSRRRAEVNNSRVGYLGSDLLITTPQVEEVEKLVRGALLLNMGKSYGRVSAMISGRPTMGKTTAAIAAMRTTFRQYTEQVPDWERLGRIPVVFVSVPSGSTPKSLMGRFADFLGLPVHPRDTKEELERVVVRNLNECRTKLIVVDEVQNLGAGNNRANGESVDALKDLSNKVHATFLYTGVEIHRGQLVAGIRGQQIAGRSSHVVLKPYTIANPVEKKSWRTIVASFENELLLYNHVPGELVSEWRYLHDRTQGNINSLARLLLGAAQDIVLEEGDPEAEKVTVERLDRIALDITAEELAATVVARSAGTRNTSKLGVNHVDAA